jgi:hypothetical protein
VSAAWEGGGGGGGAGVEENAREDCEDVKPEKTSCRKEGAVYSYIAIKLNWFYLGIKQTLG